MKRAFLIVLDSFGIGPLPDCKEFGDQCPNTLKSTTKSSLLNIPNLISLGLGNIDGVDCIEKTDTPLCIYGRAMEKSRGKDTTVGHWELAGIISENPLPTYENGFPCEIIQEFENLCGRRVICNKPYSGTQVIYDYGKEHIETGALIVYTSADSVFQIACHEEIVPVDELYRYCEIARGLLVGKHGVGRVIARPFVGEFPNFKRTSNRRDFSLAPTGETILDKLSSNGYDVISIGKIYDIFAGRGITNSSKTKSNSDGIQKTLEFLDKDFCGLCFTNLVDFDMLYGHRNDVDGYASALSEFDRHVPDILEKLRDEDLLIITADHGCDPGDTSTDHTREYIPVLVYKKGITPQNIGTLPCFCQVGEMVLKHFDLK
ncbi:MAG: phosphopentomutase [Clostridia bacterium]|nr:phosphopentomutase [Clostridia bacterium]